MGVFDPRSFALERKLNRDEEWSVMPDLFFYRNQEEIKKQEEADQKAQHESEQPLVEEAVNNEEGFEVANEDFQKPAAETENWAENTADWSAEANNGQQDWAAAESSQWS